METWGPLGVHGLSVSPTLLLRKWVGKPLNHFPHLANEEMEIHLLIEVIVKFRSGWRYLGS